MHHQNHYGSLPTWKPAPASEIVRSIYGMWSPQSYVMAIGRSVMHVGLRRWREEIVYRAETDAYKYGVHERGLLISTERELLIARMRRGQSEQRWIWRGGYDKFEPCSDGAIVQKGDKLFLATPWGRPHLLHQGPIDGWQAHPRGAIVRAFGRIILTTKAGARALLDASELEQLKTDDGREAWMPHKDGVIYMQDFQLYLAKSLVYRELIHDFNPSVKKWVPQQGYGSGFSLATMIPGAASSAEHHQMLRLSGCSWIQHPDGVLVQYENKLDLITDEGRVNLHEGRWDGWAHHPYGVVVRSGKEMTLHTGERAPIRLTDLPEGADFGAIPFSGINTACVGPMTMIF